LLAEGASIPQKGQDLLIEAFAAVAPTDPRLQLVIAGPDQVGWQAALQQRAAVLGIAERITWPGMLNG
jgi:glycosyltransferase involved in cell wall biosynthesis